jgi:hypothetical protein
MRNYFPTLSDALDAEGITFWPMGLAIQYGETAAIVHAGRYISVYRSEQGLYERPVHYATKRDDTHPL